MYQILNNLHCLKFCLFVFKIANARADEELLLEAKETQDNLEKQQVMKGRLQINNVVSVKCII